MNSESEDVLKALSSETRRTIMRQISEKGSATYTEIMQVLGLDPSLGSGRFNYHLKELSEACLIERTNGEYRITDKGKKALILVDQVAKEDKVDQYGVLSAFMSMSPRKELDLFMSQMGMMVGSMFSLTWINRILIGVNTGGLFYGLAIIGLLVSLSVAIISTVKMVNIIRKFEVGFSSMVFLSTVWPFFKSPNRNSFFVITIFIFGAIFTGIAGIGLTYTAVFPIFSPVWFGFISNGVVSATIATILSIRAKRKADRLEAMNGDQ